MIKIEMPCIEQPAQAVEVPVASVNNSSENQCWDIDRFLTSSLSQVIQLYSMHAAKVGSRMSAGGLQQYLNSRKSRDDPAWMEQPRKGAGSLTTTINDLPDNILLEIFSYLDPANLCLMCRVCQRWYRVSSDDILWRQKLHRDMFTWTVVGHMTNPDLYKECESDWSEKEIYLRCWPEMQALQKRQNAGFLQLSLVLRSLWPKKTPRIAMFGPGLESSTSALVRKILYEENNVFQKVAMFPGRFGGVGSGFTLKISSGASFHLSTLYTSTKEERQALRPDQRMQHNRMLAAEQGEGDQGNQSYQLRPAMQELCRTLDAFIFVVDAGGDLNTVRCGKSELFAMVNELWAAPGVPVLVLSCVRDTSCSRVPCLDVVRNLQLGDLNRPWQVRNCVVDGLVGIEESIEWVVDMAQRR